MNPPVDLPQRVELAKILLSSGRTEFDETELAEKAGVALAQPAAAALAALPQIPFPAGLAPIPQPINPRPPSGQALPKADVVVITWTVAEIEALCDVLTPGFPRTKWIQYDRNFAAKYDNQIRAGAPAKKSKTLGSYFVTQIGAKKVLCFKSELHLNQDGVTTGPGKATLPVKDCFCRSSSSFSWYSKTAYAFFSSLPARPASW